MPVGKTMSSNNELYRVDDAFRSQDSQLRMAAKDGNIARVSELLRSILVEDINKFDEV
jgi:hypothetical protein